MYITKHNVTMSVYGIASKTMNQWKLCLSTLAELFHNKELNACNICGSAIT